MIASISYKTFFNNKLGKEGIHMEEILSDYKDVLTLAEVQTILKISKSKAYQLLQSKEIASFRLGKQYRVLKQTLIDFIKSTDK